MSANNELSLLMKEEAEESLLYMGIYIPKEEMRLLRENTYNFSFMYDDKVVIKAYLDFNSKASGRTSYKGSDKVLHVCVGIGKSQKRCVFWRPKGI